MPNFVAMMTLSRCRVKSAEQPLVGERAVRVGGVPERHPQLQGPLEGRRRRGVLDPILGGHHPVHTYLPGSWGPAQADALTAPHGTWHNPAPA